MNIIAEIKKLQLRIDELKSQLSEENNSSSYAQERESNAAISSIDGSQGYGLCMCCGGGSYSHNCDNCGAYID